MTGYKRSALSIFVLLIAATVFAALPALADPVVNIQPSLSTPDMGSLFDVSVNISAVTDLYAFQFDITFDPAILSAVSVTEGAFLPGGGATFFIPGSIDNTGGSITFTGDSLISAIAGVNGAGTLADINFQALSGGTSSIDLANIVLLDSTVSDIPFSSAGGTVSPIGSVPEPSTMVLLGLGLIGVAWVRKKVTK